MHARPQELESSQHRAAAVVMDVEGRAAEALAAARMEHDATLARHLSFMVGVRSARAGPQWACVRACVCVCMCVCVCLV